MALAVKHSRAAALALTLLLHLGVLGAALAPRYELAGAAPAVAPTAPRVLTVRLLVPAGNAAPAPAAALEAAPSNAPPADTALSAPAPAALAPSAQEAAQPEFLAPALASGMEGPQLLLVPGIEAANLALRLWVGADGVVQRVELGQHGYSDADAQRLYETLMQVRFHPARRLGSPVPAELALYVRVVGDLGA